MAEESGKLDFLEETEEAEVVEQVEAPAEPDPVEAKGEDDEVAPPATAEEKPQAIPLTALLDEREKRQEATRRAEVAERRLQEIERRIAASQQPQKRPDWFEKPDEAIRHAVAPIQQQVLSVKLQQSRFLAEKDFGPDLVKEAFAYFDQHPEESHKMLDHPSPFHAAVQHYKRQKFLSEVGEDPESWLEAQVKARLEQISPQSPAPANRPPPSLSRAPAAGRSENTKPGSAFDALPIR